MYNEGLLYTRVTMPIMDFLSGKLPHVQPGTDMLFREEPEDIKGMHTDASPDKLEVMVDIGVEYYDSLSEISVKEARQRFNNPNLRAGFDDLYAGTLNPHQITWCRVALPKDVLYTETTIGAEAPDECEMEVKLGNTPNYLVAQDMAMRHFVSMAALQQILQNSEPELAHAVQAELERTMTEKYPWGYSAPQAEVSTMAPEEYEKITECVKALRCFLPSNQICSQNFTAYGNLQLQGIAYANPIGMDLPMRVVQQCVQSIIPHTDVSTIASLNDFQEALNHQADLDKRGDRLVSQQTMQRCLHDACEEWKQVAPDSLKPHIERIQQNLNNMIEQARAEIMTPENFRMRQIMSRAQHIKPYKEPHPSIHFENGVMEQYQYELLRAGRETPGATMEQLVASALERTYQRAQETIGFHDIRGDYIAMAARSYANNVYPDYDKADVLYRKLVDIFARKERELSLPDDLTPKEAMICIMQASAEEISSLTNTPQEKLPTIDEVQAGMYVPNHDLYLGYICRDTPVALATELQNRFDEKFFVNELDDVLAKRNPNLRGDIELRAYTVWQLTKEMQREYAPNSPEYAALAAIRENSIANLHSRIYEDSQAEYHTALVEAFEQDDLGDEDIGDDTVK